MVMTASTMLALGTTTPDFQLPDTEGNTVSVTDFKEAPALLVTIEGHVYSEDRNQQFQLVGQFLKNLRNSEEFSLFFYEIEHR